MTNIKDDWQDEQESNPARTRTFAHTNIEGRVREREGRERESYVRPDKDALYYFARASKHWQRPAKHVTRDDANLPLSQSHVPGWQPQRPAAVISVRCSAAACDLNHEPAAAITVWAELQVRVVILDELDSSASFRMDRCVVTSTCPIDFTFCILN